MEQHPALGLEQGDAEQTAGSQRFSDEFMMFVFKVQMCKRVDKHEREKCPFAHPGELARRRHPSLYQALPCPEARAKRICPRLENCNCSHSTFEFWLHPDRYKTILCEQGHHCNRPVCFFAHSEDELRELPQGLQRTKPTHKPASGGGHSAPGGTDGAGSSRQAAAGSSAGPSSHLGNLMGAQGSMEMPQYLAQPMYMHQPQPGGEQGQLIVGYESAMQHPQQQQGLLQPGMQYVTVPIQQPRTSDTGIGARPEGPTVLMPPGQVLYASSPLGPNRQQPGQQVPAAGQQHVEGVVYSTQQQLQVGYAPRAAPPGLEHGSSVMYARPQVLVGYPPVLVGSTSGYAGPQSVVMVRPTRQRGSTVAVIPAGPSAWAGHVSAEAPSLEALCASLGQMSIPTTEQPQHLQLLLQQYQQPQQYAAQQQQLPGQQVPAALPGPLLLPPPQQQLLHQQPPGVSGQQVMYAAPSGVQQVLAAPSGQQAAQQQLLPGQQVMVVMPSAGEGASLQSGWGGVGSMQP